MKRSPDHKQSRKNTRRQGKARPAPGGSRPDPAAARDQKGIRLNRFIAQAGICSRRKADELIQAGRVVLNGNVVREMGVRVSESDVVEVSGQRIEPKGYEYILLNKPSDTITTNSDDRGRKIVLDLIEDEQIARRGVFPVGRLDRNTVGVLLITNDGELAHRLMHPSYNIEKLYIVRTKESVQPHELDQMRTGVQIEGDTYRVDKVEYISLPKQTELGISLHEGKNRHIRRILETLGHKTVYLERVRYAGLTASGVRRGKWRRLNPAEIRRLRRLVKLK